MDERIESKRFFPFLEGSNLAYDYYCFLKSFALFRKHFL
jgi:hypothetical protein